MKLVQFHRWNPGWSLVLWRWQIDRHYMVNGSKLLLKGRRNV